MLGLVSFLHADCTAMKRPSPDDLRTFQTYLDGLVARYEQPSFIEDDPIAIPRGFDDPRDQEVIGLYAALLAWGQRKTILNKMADLCERMHYQPYRFVYDYGEGQGRDALAGFKHRTFQPIDAHWFTRNLSSALRQHNTIEALFARHMMGKDADVGPAIQGFSKSLLEGHPETPPRLRKHLARPKARSACKRLCMYLRWMVRPGPVDFGIWTNIRPNQLVLPLDVHSGRQARALGLLNRKANDWRAATELTASCKQFDANDPAKYDFALFGVGAYSEALDPRFVDDNRTDWTSLPIAR